MREWGGASPGRDLPLLLLFSFLHGAKELFPNLWLIGLLRGPQIHRWPKGGPLSLFQLQAKHELEDLEAQVPPVPHPQLYYMCFQLLLRRRQWHPTSVLLPGKSHGWRSLVGCSPWGHEELDTTERLHFHFSLSCIGGGNGNPLQCSCLDTPRDRGAW